MTDTATTAPSRPATSAEPGSTCGASNLMLEALDDFVDAAALPDSRSSSSTTRTVCPEDTVRAMCRPMRSACSWSSSPRSTAGWAAARSTPTGCASGWPASTSASRRSVFATFLGSDPILMGGTEEQKKEWLGRIAERGHPLRLRGDRAGGRQRPRRDDDDRHARSRTTTATVTGYRINGRKQWISNGSHRRRLHDPRHGPGRAVLVRRGEGHRRASPPAPPEDKHGIRLSNTAALFLDDVEVPADNLVGGVEGLGLVQAQQVFGYTRLMVAAFGLGGGWEALDRAIALLHAAGAGRRPAEREAGLHPQADRPARRAPGGGPGVHRGDRRPARRRSGRRRRAEHRGRHRQVPGHRGRERRRRRRDPGARRLRLHPALRRGEDPPRRPDHHDLRGHLGDHGDDHRPGPLAAAPQDPRRATTSTWPTEMAPCTPRNPRVGADVAALGARRPWPPSSRPAGSAGSPATSTCCFRLGELVAHAEAAVVFARAADAADGGPPLREVADPVRPARPWPR